MEAGVNQQPRSRKTLWLVVSLIVLVLIVAALFVFAAKLLPQPKTEGYQAVFLTNNQVYFGKLAVQGEWIKLTDVYYLQVSGSLQQTAGADAANNSNGQQEMKLVKLGSELHGPQDSMYIGRDKVLFWENMKEDSKVLDAIRKYNAK